MFVPGHIEKYMNAAWRSGADILLPDLEDSVPTSDDKKKALENIEMHALEGKFNGLPVFPRVNDAESGIVGGEIWRLAINGITGFIIPKIKTGQDIIFFSNLIWEIERVKNIPFGTFKLIPLIETAAAVMNIQSICSASARIVAVAFGAEDFMNDLQGVRDTAGHSIFTARAMIAMAARASGIAAIDTVHTNVFDFDDLQKNCETARGLGFDGMLALNPKEIPVIHSWFSPSESDVERAREIIRLSEQASGYGKGVAIIDGKFIGPPMVELAKKTIEKYNMIQQKTEA